MPNPFGALSLEARERLRIYHERRRAEAEMKLFGMPPVPPIADTSADARAVRATRGQRSDGSTSRAARWLHSRRRRRDDRRQAYRHRGR